MKCPVCEIESSVNKLKKHLSKEHPEFVKQQEEEICRLFRETLLPISEISKRVWYNEIKIKRLLREKFTAEERKERKYKCASKTKLEDNQFECPLCKVKLPTLESLKRHMEISLDPKHSEQVFKGREGIDYAICQVCRLRRHNLTMHLNLQHNMSKEQYKEKFTNAILVCQKSLDMITGDNNPLKREENREKFRGENNPMYGTESPNRGKKMTEEQKRKISEANRGRIFTEEHRKKLSIARRKQND